MVRAKQFGGKQSRAGHPLTSFARQHSRAALFALIESKKKQCIYSFMSTVRTFNHAREKKIKPNQAANISLNLQFLRGNSRSPSFSGYSKCPNVEERGLLYIPSH